MWSTVGQGPPYAKRRPSARTGGLLLCAAQSEVERHLRPGQFDVEILSGGYPVCAVLHGIAMSLKLGLSIALRSLLALASASAVVVLVNLGGGELADTTGFPHGGEARLAWDLGWVFLAGASAAWVVVTLAPRAPLMHAAAFFALMMIVSGLAVIQLGGDWPRWLSAGVLLAVPLQTVLGAGWALRGRKRA